MVRRLFTLVLAGILTLETPMTAYASNQNGVILEDVFGREENTSSDTSNQKAYDIPDDSSDNSINNDSNDNIGYNHNNDSDNEVSDMPDIDTGNNTESGAETSTETGTNTETGTDTETNTESGTNTETETKADADPDTADNPDADVNDKDNQGKDNQTEDSLNNEDSQDDKDYQNMEEVVEAEVVNSLQYYDEIIEIDYNAAVTEGVTVTAPYESDGSAYYSMTAPEDGYYAFYSDEEVENKYTYMAFYSLPTDIDKINPYRYRYLSSSEYLLIATRYMKKGEKIYIKMYNTKGEENYTLKVAGQAELTKNAENSYSYVLPDGNSIEINAVAGYKHLKYDFAMKANPETGKALSGSYYLCHYSEYEDGEDAGSGEDTLNSNNKYSYSETISCAMGSVYNHYYMLTDVNQRLIALLAGADSLRTGNTDENLYIHNEICEENSITLDIEPIAESNMICYYAPADASEPGKLCDISGWKTIEFTDLSPGTEYTFKFYNTDKTILYDTRQISTTQGSVFSEIKDYFAEVDDSFEYMNLGATISDFRGVSTYVLLNYEYTDSIGIVRNGHYRIDNIIDNISADSKISLKQPDSLRNKAVFAGDEYDVKLWLEFPEDNITTKAVTVSAKVPENACLKKMI